jgi:D-alanyl-D-alanine carboxypeptidase
LIAAVAADAEKQTPAKRGKKSKIAAKPDAAAEAEAWRSRQPSLRRQACERQTRTLPPSQPGSAEKKSPPRPNERPPPAVAAGESPRRSRRPSRRLPLNPRAKTSRLVNGPRSP